ncbi:phosphate propanoyltransferase [Lysinibacillus capsici]|uniref:Phosphate propanoyltransferase n=1 Tax=Lysinibacillus capsici TaxID=2115968 RepID=A0ABY8KJR9_9BACI|nr:MULTISPECIES: phosphate propanoyltransferase [Lysinibacillus]WGF38778.1 phosphate propanoyltransferase [Lysinibacillus capsici]
MTNNQIHATEVTNQSIPIAISARHCHVNEEDFYYLFGRDAALQKWKELSQPGQFASQHVLTIKGPKGQIDKVRVLGPFRTATQIEISQTDAIKLGVTPPIRMSGDLEKSESITLIGPHGTRHKTQGLIIAQAHIHMAVSDAAAFNVQDKEIVTVEICGDGRQLRLMNVVVRVSSAFVLEMHVDTDEANAAALQQHTIGKLIKME